MADVGEAVSVGDSFVGEMDRYLEDSVIRDNEKVRSSDWARLVMFPFDCFSLASSRESEPRLKASSITRDCC